MNNHLKRRGLSMIEMISALAITATVVGGVAVVVGQISKDQRLQAGAVQERGTITRVTQTVRESLQGMNLIGWVDNVRHPGYAREWGATPQRFTLLYLDPSRSAELDGSGQLTEPSPISGGMGAIVEQIPNPNRPGRKMVQIRVLPNPGSGMTPNTSASLTYTYPDAECAQDFTPRLYRAHALTIQHEAASRQVVEIRDFGASRRVAANLVSGMSARYTNEGINLALQVVDSAAALSGRQGSAESRGQTLSETMALSGSWNLSGTSCALRPATPVITDTSPNVFYTVGGLPDNTLTLRTSAGPVRVENGVASKRVGRGPLQTLAPDLRIPGVQTAAGEPNALRQFVPLLSEAQAPETLDNPLNLTVGNNPLHIHAGYAPVAGEISGGAIGGDAPEATGPLNDELEIEDTRTLGRPEGVRPGAYAVQFKGQPIASGATVTYLSEVKSRSGQNGWKQEATALFTLPVDSGWLRPQNVSYVGKTPGTPVRASEAQGSYATVTLKPKVTNAAGQTFGSGSASGPVGTVSNCVLGERRETSVRTYQVPQRYMDGTPTGKMATATETTVTRMEDLGCATVTAAGQKVLGQEFAALSNNEDAKACQNAPKMGSGRRVVRTISGAHQELRLTQRVASAARQAAGQQQQSVIEVVGGNWGNSLEVTCTWTELERSVTVQEPNPVPNNCCETPGKGEGSQGVYARIPDGTPMTEDEWKALEPWQRGYYPDVQSAEQRDMSSLKKGKADDMSECLTLFCSNDRGSGPDPVTTEPVTPEPVTTEPVTTEPVTTEPVTTEPAPPGEPDPGTTPPRTPYIPI